jgi:hypothetical protein
MVRESVYYWNPHRDRLEFLVLTNNGHVGSGTVAVEAAAWTRHRLRGDDTQIVPRITT